MSGNSFFISLEEVYTWELDDNKTNEELVTRKRAEYKDIVNRLKFGSFQSEFPPEFVPFLTDGTGSYSQEANKQLSLGLTFEIVFRCKRLVEASICHIVRPVMDL